MLIPGTILGGKYELDVPIGEGGMGVVWRAKRAGWSAPVAIKLIHQAHISLPGALERFRQEARLAADLRGPHVVQVLDDGVDEPTGTHYIVMELLGGETLAQRLDHAKRLRPEETLRILRQVGLALAAAHERQLVHRDLKPENIFLVRQQGVDVVKVVDFGVAKSLPEAAHVRALTETGNVIGTPHYMSPEQIGDSSRVDYRSDLWSFAVIAFECLTGRRPFQSDSLVGLAFQITRGPRPIPSSIATVPAGFDAWFARAVAVDIEQRFQSVSEQCDRLDHACRELMPALADVPTYLPEPTSVAPDSRDGSMRTVSAPAPARAPRPRGRLAVATFGLALMALGALTASWIMPSWPEPMVVLPGGPLDSKSSSASSALDVAAEPAAPAATAAPSTAASVAPPSVGEVKPSTIRSKGARNAPTTGHAPVAPQSVVREQEPPRWNPVFDETPEKDEKPPAPTGGRWNPAFDR